MLPVRLALIAPMLAPMLAMLGCAPYPEGLLATPEGGGPLITIDWDAQPLPEIPFPNDLATRPDRGSVTGLRLNISEAAETQHQSDDRRKINELTGFGIYSAIAVGFEAPLDLDNIAARHRDDPALGDAQFPDDAFYVINVDPDSPQYLEPVELDVGHGRFPADTWNSERYLPNDTRSQHPSVVFDTVNEDLNGDGVLDWGEDSDNDGVLDVANVYPVGGDPWEDLHTWYERNSNTLIFRPVVPLAEETTYAVVLTNRLLGEAGEPVRSPWEYVHHLRQGEALYPLFDAMPALGLEMEHVAFAWTFTTGRVTGDLVDIRRGLDGVGPLAQLADEYTSGIVEAHFMHEADDLENQLVLPSERLLNELADLGVADQEDLDIVAGTYVGFEVGLVGGAYEVPYFVGDWNQNGTDFDDYFRIDPIRGAYLAERRRVPFTCLIPGRSELESPPYPTVILGHGYGSSRFDAVLAAFAFNHMGMAVCANDFPGHQVVIPEEFEELVETLFDTLGLAPLREHLLDGRGRDLDNSGEIISGGDQWSADGFHTRDMVRQAAVDWMRFVDALQMCGEGTMETDGGPVMSCDWDQDGTPDIGGPDGEFFIVGGSLGGINSAVAAAVMPDVTAWVPLIPGGGLIDVALRTEIGGAVEAMHHRLMSPLFYGTPDDTGGLTIYQAVNSVMDTYHLPVVTLDSFPAGGRVELENLDNGVLREGYIPADGTFRIGIPADAPNYVEKASLAGIPEGGAGATAYSVDDNAGLGDALVLRLYDAQDALVQEIDTWEGAVYHEGVTMEAGSPLIAGGPGSGYVRASTDLRRLAMIFGSVLEPGDPISYAPHYNNNPFGPLGGEQINILLMPSPGDSIVPINGGIALARAAGFIERGNQDSRYGMSQDQFLIDRQVVRGIADRGPWTCFAGTDAAIPCLFDADNLDNGVNTYDEPSDQPLRINIPNNVGMSGLRLPYSDPDGSHGFGTPDPDSPFDIATFGFYQAATYFHERGQTIRDDTCLEDATCDWIPATPESGR